MKTAKELKAASLQELAEEMREIESRLETLKALTTQVQKEYDYMRKVVIPARMEEENVEQLRITGIGTLGLRKGIYASIRKDKKAEAMNYLKTLGYGEMIEEKIDARRIPTIIKECLEEGEAIPDELFNITPKVTAYILK